MVALCMDVGLEVYLAVVDVLTSAEFEPHFRTIILLLVVLSNNSENVFKCRVPLSVAFPSLFSTLTTSNPEG